MAGHVRQDDVRIVALPGVPVAAADAAGRHADDDATRWRFGRGHLAYLERTVTPDDEVFLRVTRDGQVLETTLQDPGTYDCLGSEAPEPPLLAGTYPYEVIVNGTVSATGALFVG